MASGTDQKIKRASVLLTGASSQIGVFVIPKLVQAGFRVLAVSRKGKPDDYPRFDQVRWINDSEAQDAAGNCEFLVSAGPLELAYRFVLSNTCMQNIVVFSSSSVESKRESSSLAEREQIENMLVLESKLRLVSEDRAIRLVIFRPTLIYGCGLDTNISRLASWVRRYGWLPVNGRASGQRQPVHADDLATAAVSALLSKIELPQVMFLTGGEVLSYADMVARIFVALGKQERLYHLPQWAFVAAVKLAGALSLFGGINSEMVIRQNIDLVFDDCEARELIAYKPRSFAPTEADFVLPDFKPDQEV